MAYKSSVTFETTTTDVYNRIAATLDSMGWELHDNLSAWSKIYKSNGENADRPYLYLHLDGGTGATPANYIFTRVYGYWDKNTTHSGKFKCLDSYSYFYAVANNWIVISGDKDFVVLSGGVTLQTFSSFDYFGFVPKLADETRTFLTAPASAGSSVVLNVKDTSEFRFGNIYNIVGAKGEGTQWGAAIESINSDTSMTISNLEINLSTGSVIGGYPHAFGASTYSGAFRLGLCFPRSCSGAEEPVGNYHWLANTYSIPTNVARNKGVYGKIALASIVLNEGAQPVITDEGIVGTMGQNVLMAPYTTAGIYGISKGHRINGSVALATATTLKKTGLANFKINECADKVVVIVDGSGVDHTRVIASNTADEISIHVPWIEQPDGTSDFYIVDKAYRHTRAGIAVLERVE